MDANNLSKKDRRWYESSYSKSSSSDRSRCDQTSLTKQLCTDKLEREKRHRSRSPSSRDHWQGEDDAPWHSHSSCRSEHKKVCGQRRKSSERYTHRKQRSSRSSNRDISFDGLLQHTGYSQSHTPSSGRQSDHSHSRSRSPLCVSYKSSKNLTEQRCTDQQVRRKAYKRSYSASSRDQQCIASAALQYSRSSYGSQEEEKVYERGRKSSDRQRHEMSTLSRSSNRDNSSDTRSRRTSDSRSSSPRPKRDCYSSERDHRHRRSHSPLCVRHESPKRIEMCSHKEPSESERVKGNQVRSYITSFKMSEELYVDRKLKGETRSLMHCSPNELNCQRLTLKDSSEHDGERVTIMKKEYDIRLDMLSKYEAQRVPQHRENLVLPACSLSKNPILAPNTAKSTALHKRFKKQQKKHRRFIAFQMNEIVPRQQKVIRPTREFAIKHTACIIDMDGFSMPKVGVGPSFLCKELGVAYMYKNQSASYTFQVGNFDKLHPRAKPHVVWVTQQIHGMDFRDAPGDKPRSSLIPLLASIRNTCIAESGRCYVAFKGGQYERNALNAAGIHTYYNLEEIGCPKYEVLLDHYNIKSDSTCGLHCYIDPGKVAHCPQSETDLFRLWLLDDTPPLTENFRTFQSKNVLM